MNVEAMRLDHLKSVIVGIANRRRLVADAAIVRETTRTSPESTMRIPFAPIASADLCEVGVLKAGAKRNYAGLLLLNIDEVEELIIEDDLNYRGPSLHLRQQITHSEHSEAAVTAQGDRLPGIPIAHETHWRGIGHRRP
jgi:hypothetical protein